jgi:multiple sugar transport system permease protein
LLHRQRSFVDRHFFLLAALPAFLIVFLVTVVPVAFALYLSLTGYTPVDPTFTFHGLRNYHLLLVDPIVHSVIGTTFQFVAVTLIVETVLGVGAALLLATPMRGIGIFRTLYLMPLMVAGIASAITWRALFNTSNGWLNYFLGLLHLPQPNWLADPTMAMPAVIAADAWTGAPVIAVIVLAGLLALPREPLEAATVDGASELQMLRYVILPGIRPVLAFAILFRMVDLFRQFPLFQIMTGGGPGMATSVLNYYVYQTTFLFGELGYGAALAILLVLLMIVPLALTFWFARREA